MRSVRRRLMSRAAAPAVGTDGDGGGIEQLPDEGFGVRWDESVELVTGGEHVPLAHPRVVSENRGQPR